MSVVYDVKEDFQGGIESEMSDNGYLTATIVRNFTIAVSEPTVDQKPITPLDVKFKAFAATPSLPREGDRHPSNVNFICKSVSIEKVSVIYYTAACSYESPTFEAGDEVVNPLSIPAEITFSTQVSEEETQSDIFGNALENTAGSPYVGITMEITDMAISINKNVASFNPTLMQYFNGAVNSDAFLGYAAGQIKLQNYTASPVIGEINYWKLGIQMLARTPTDQVPAEKVWFRRVQNKGRYVLDSTGKPFPAKLGENSMISTNVEVNLDESGQRLPDGATPIFQFFQMNRTASFRGLGIL